LPEGGEQVPSTAWREFAIMGSFTFVTIVYFKVDVLMLSFMVDRTAAGNYDNAYNFVEGALFISAAAGTILYPRLIQTRGTERANLFDATFKVVLALGCCGTAALWALGELFGRLVIGELFAGAVRPLLILAAALPIMFVNGLLNRWLFTHHRERFALVCAAGVAVFNLVGNYLVIPTHGEAGAALITLLTEAALLVLWLAWGRQCQRLPLWCLAAFVLLGGIGYLCIATPIGGIAAFAGLALFCLLLLWRLHRLNQLTGR
jgi:O-antigen/teichoic acid export membrane protein